MVIYETIMVIYNRFASIYRVYMKDFSMRLETALKSRGISKAELARQSGVPAQNVTHWLARGGVSKRKLFNVAGVLGVSPQLLGEGVGAINARMEAVGSRLSAARKRADFTVKRASGSLGIPASLLEQIEQGRVWQIEPAIAEYASLYGVRIDALKETNQFIKDADSSDENTEPVDMRRPGRVPLVSWVQAGEWTSVEGAFEAHNSDEWVLCPVPHSEKTFVLRVRGASMEPEYRDGDWIFVDPEGRSENGSHVVVMLDSAKEATFKKLVLEGDETFLEALNPDWPDRVLRVNGNATIVGTVIFSGKPR
jgi:SOS-response transcriptional repressor LexA